MSVIIYWIAIRLYVLSVKVAALFNPKAKLFMQGRKQLLTHIRYSLFDEKRPRIWIHCASLGEFEQGRPVIEKLKLEYPSYAIIITFFSPSGYEARKNYLGANYIFYLPIDSKFNANHFLDSVKPSLAVFVKYEFWYFFLMRLSARKIPTLLVSAIFRQGQPFFKWYGKLHVKMLKAFTHIFVQDKQSQDLLAGIGVKDVSIAGDTRFDRVSAVLTENRKLEYMTSFCADSKVIVAGSTWPQDELMIKEIHDTLSADWKIVIAPHEISEKHIIAIMQQYEGEAVLLSEFKEEYYDQRVLIVDTIGQLLWLYKYADVTYVGGGFNKSGIHNILEAAVYGKPVFHGPEYHKFREAVELNKLGAAFAVDKATAIADKINMWTIDRINYTATCVSAKKYVKENTGAINAIVQYVQEKQFLSN